MCSSLVAGFAGAHLWSRASTPNARSTAGFLFITWGVGLVQTGQQSVLAHASINENMDAESWFLVVIVLLAGPLMGLQAVWILYLPLQRLESLQQTAGREIIPVPNLKNRVFQFGADSQLDLGKLFRLFFVRHKGGQGCR